MPATQIHEQLSLDGRYKTTVEQRPDGRYAVYTLRWHHEIVPGYGEVAAFWEEHAGPVFTDRLDEALRLARTELPGAAEQ